MKTLTAIFYKEDTYVAECPEAGTFRGNNRRHFEKSQRDY